MKFSRTFFVLFALSAGTVLLAGCGVKNPFAGGAQTQETQQVALPSSTEQSAKEATFDPPSYRADYSTSLTAEASVQPDGKGPRTLASTLATVTTPTTYVMEGDNGESYAVTVEPVSSATSTTSTTANSAPTITYVPTGSGQTVRHSYYAASTDTMRYVTSTYSTRTVSRPFHGLSGYGTQPYYGQNSGCPNPDIYTPPSPNCAYQTTRPFHGLR